MVEYLLVALLTALAALVAALFLTNRAQTRRAERALRLKQEFQALVQAWSQRDPLPEEIGRLRSLADLDRPTLFQACLQLNNLESATAERIRSGLQRSGIIAGLLADLAHRSAGRRAEACSILGRAGYAGAIAPLTERLHDRDPRVQHCAISALCELKAIQAIERITMVMETSGRWTDLLAIMALSRMGSAAVPAIGALLQRSESQAMTKALLQVTTQLGSAADPAMIRRLARHDAPEVRVEAVRTLGHIPPEPESVDVCVAALDDVAWPTRALAARSLGRLKDPRATPRLERAVGDTAYWVRHHAAEALAQLGGTGQAALRQRLTDVNPFVRDMAAQVLFTDAATRATT
jgi:HEAT repeat protein